MWLLKSWIWPKMSYHSNTDSALVWARRDVRYHPGLGSHMSICFWSSAFQPKTAGACLKKWSDSCFHYIKLKRTNKQKTLCLKCSVFMNLWIVNYLMSKKKNIKLYISLNKSNSANIYPVFFIHLKECYNSLLQQKICL